MRECECKGVKEGTEEGGLFPSECEHGQSCMGVVIVVVLGDPRLHAVLGVVLSITWYQVANVLLRAKGCKFNLYNLLFHRIYYAIISAYKSILSDKFAYNITG